MSNDMHITPIKEDTSLPGIPEGKTKKPEDPAQMAIKHVHEDFSVANTKDLDSHTVVIYPTQNSDQVMTTVEAAQATDEPIIFDESEEFFSETSDEEFSFSKFTAQKVTAAATILQGESTEEAGLETEATRETKFQEVCTHVEMTTLSFLKAQDLYCTNTPLLKKCTADKVNELYQENVPPDISEIREVEVQSSQLFELAKSIVYALAEAHVLKEEGADGTLQDISEERLAKLVEELGKELSKTFAELGWTVRAERPQEEKEQKAAKEKLESHAFTAAKPEVPSEVISHYRKKRELPENVPLIVKILLSSSELVFSKISEKEREKKADEERLRIYEQIIFRQIINEEVQKFELKRQLLNQTIVKAHAIAAPAA